MPNNLSYCRFQNTLIDLRDCGEHLYDILSPHEVEARARLIALCKEIAADFEDDEEAGR
jgi:hypothetical protein